MDKGDTLKILHYLSKMFNGSMNELVRTIYETKRELEEYEYNDNLSYHNYIGLLNKRIKSSEIICDKRNYYRRTPDNKITKYFEGSSVMQKSIIGGDYGWKYFTGPSDVQFNIVPRLHDNIIYNQNVMLSCISDPNGMIKVKLLDGTYENPSLKQKIYVINKIVKMSGISYLDMIKGEFMNNDIEHCIVFDYTRPGIVQLPDLSDVVIFGGTYLVGVNV
jgi:hypothetical protein